MTSSIFRPRRLGHVNLFVDGLDRSTAFYHDVCGLAVQFSETGLKAQFLGTGHTPHDLGMIETTKGVDRYGKDGHLQIPGNVGRTVSLNHLAWEMETEAELVGAIRRCRDEGIAIGRLADHQIAHSAYMTDPDGNPLEFYVDTIRDWRRVLQGDVDLITSVWDPEAAAPRTEPMYDPDPTLDRVEAAPLHPVRLSHAVLATANLAAMVRFYVAVAGLEVVDRTAETALLRGRQSAGAFDLALIAAGEGIPEGLHHFAFDLPEGTDVEELAQRLEALGVRIDRVWRDGHKSSLFLADPDGWRIEFLVRSGHGRPVAHAPAGDRAYAL